MVNLQSLKYAARACLSPGYKSINPNVYYKWSKDFLEAGRKRLDGDTVREANGDQVKALREENNQLKQVVADLLLKNRILKKSLTDSEGPADDL